MIQTKKSFWSSGNPSNLKNPSYPNLLIAIWMDSRPKSIGNKKGCQPMLQVCWSRLFVCLNIYIFIYFLITLGKPLSETLFFRGAQQLHTQCLFVCLFVCLSVCLSVCLFVCLGGFFWVFFHLYTGQYASFLKGHGAAKQLLLNKGHPMRKLSSCTGADSHNVLYYPFKSSPLIVT